MDDKQCDNGMTEQQNNKTAKWQNDEMRGTINDEMTSDEMRDD